MDSRSSNTIYLLGHDESQIVSSKLPSNGQVLRVLYYNLRKVKLEIRPSAAMVIKEVEVFWEKARIPVKQSYNSITKLIALYESLRLLQRSEKRRSELQESKEKKFLDSLDDLFDIAHSDALTMMHIESDKHFLLNQRQKGRPGSMIGVDRNLTEMEQRKTIRQEEDEIRKQRFDAMAEVEGIYI